MKDMQWQGKTIINKPSVNNYIIFLIDIVLVDRLTLNFDHSFHCVKKGKASLKFSLFIFLVSSVHIFLNRWLANAYWTPSTLFEIMKKENLSSKFCFSRGNSAEEFRNFDGIANFLFG